MVDASGYVQRLLAADEKVCANIDAGGEVCLVGITRRKVTRAEDHSARQPCKGHHPVMIVGEVPSWAEGLEAASVVIPKDPENLNWNDREIPLESPANPAAPVLVREYTSGVKAEGQIADVAIRSKKVRTRNLHNREAARNLAAVVPRRMPQWSGRCIVHSLRRHPGGEPDDEAE